MKVLMELSAELVPAKYKDLKKMSKESFGTKDKSMCLLIQN
jgi:hypothetical protein